MSENIVIKFADLEDAEKAIDIARKSFAGKWFVIGDIIRGAAKKGNLLVALNLNKVLGYVRVIVASDHIHISEIAVDPDYRNIDIGSLLIKEISSISLGFPITVKTDMATNFFIKQGFKIRGQTPSRKGTKFYEVLVLGDFPKGNFDKFLNEKVPRGVRLSLRDDFFKRKNQLTIYLNGE